MGLFDGTEFERPVVCDRCGQKLGLCTCPPPDVPPLKQSLKVRLEKRKRGKLVTVIAGFQCSIAQLEETLRALKSQCGAGGSINEQNIELQGDHTTRVPQLLVNRGYRVQGFKQ